jgi:hypothetical protein
MELINSLDKLRIILFWDILKEQNYFLLDTNYSKDKKYSQIEGEEILSVWYKLYDEYYSLKNDQKAKLFLSKAINEMKLKIKTENITNTANFLVDLENHYRDILEPEQFSEYEQKLYSLIKELEPKIRIKHFEGIPFNIKTIQSVVNALTTQLTLMQKKTEKVIDNEIQNVYKIVASVEQILERSIPNINDISVMQWLAYEEIANEKIKSVKNGKQR